MVEEEPLWQYTTKNALWRWYGHVHLTDRHAVGQWLVIALESGEVLWDADFDPPNTISGISNDMIIATEMITSGPTTYHAGIWGISLLTGETVWQARRSGFLGRLIDTFVAYGDSPAEVTNDRCITVNGRMLDLNTGEEIGSVPPRNKPAKTTDANRLYRKERVTLKNGQVVCLSKPGSVPGFGLDLFSNRGEPLWQFRLAEQDRYIDGNFYSYRLHDREVYLLVSDEEQYEGPKMNPARFELWVLSLKKQGEIVQRIPIGHEPLVMCRFEAIDDDYVLISDNAKTLRAHRQMKFC